MQVIIDDQFVWLEEMYIKIINMVYLDYKMAKAQQHILLCSTCIIIFGKMMSSHASFPFHDFDTKDCVIKNNSLYCRFISLYGNFM